MFVKYRYDGRQDYKYNSEKPVPSVTPDRNGAYNKYMPSHQERLGRPVAGADVRNNYRGGAGNYISPEPRRQDVSPVNPNETPEKRPYEIPDGYHRRPQTALPEAQKRSKSQATYGKRGRQEPTASYQMPGPQANFGGYNPEPQANSRGYNPDAYQRGPNYQGYRGGEAYMNPRDKYRQPEMGMAVPRLDMPQRPEYSKVSRPMESGYPASQSKPMPVANPNESAEK